MVEFTDNIKILSICAFLFQLITAVQFFYALAVGSNSLMSDCISMEIDVITYLGNIYAEIKRQAGELTDLDKAKISLITSGLSIAILFAVTIWILHDVIETLLDTPIKDDLHPAWYLIIFGGCGFLFDLIALKAFSVWGDPDSMGVNAGAPDAADAEAGVKTVAKLTSVVSKQVEGTAVAEEKASAMTMCSALSHVFADCIRSLTALTVGIAAVGWKRKVNGAKADSVGALICSATIFVLAVGLIQQWFKAMKVYLNYDKYEHVEIIRPSTKAQGIARILSSATSYDLKPEAK
jgi:Co/Zn/Cd efflux system component